MESLSRFHPRERHSDDPTHPGRLEEHRTSAPLPTPSYNESHGKNPSLDITQKLEKKLAELNASENVFRRWLFEIISWMISALSMGAMIGILAYLNNQSLNKWPPGLALQTALSKLASAALILPTSEALGQLKWNWFHGKKSKEMWDFEIFDKASRGAWGSVLLLFRTKGRSLAALGAILTLLLIANDTIFQQVISLPEHWVLEGESSMPKLTRFQDELGIEYRNGIQQAQQDQELQPLVRKFFYSNGTHPIQFGNGTRPDLPVSCPSSKCTWPQYETLGVCSSCVDASQLLTQGCFTTTADWIGNLTGWQGMANYPNGTMCGYFLNATSSLPVMMSGYLVDEVESTEGRGLPGEALLMRALPLVTIGLREPLYGGSVHFKNHRLPIADFLVVGAVDGPSSVYRNETPIAHECILSWCIKTLQSSYQEGTYTEVIKKEFLNNTAGPHPWITKRASNSVMMSYLENVTFDGTSINRDYSEYGLNNETAMRVINIFDDMLPSFWTIANSTAEPMLRYRVNVEGLARSRKIIMNPWLPPNNVSHHMERFAVAITNYIRSSSDTTMVAGAAFNVQTYISVQWAWLTFPFALLILSFVFLVATMYKTSKEASQSGQVGIWKTSAMPTLIYSLPGELQKQFTSASARSGTKSDGAKTLKLRLHPDKGWRVSGHQCSPDTPVLGSSFSRQSPPG